jgi:hypothetical protein
LGLEVVALIMVGSFLSGLRAPPMDLVYA